MARRAFDYSKWDNIELSDDESDLHPNIDKDSWFRMKHRHRLEREEREDEEIRVMKKENAEDQRRLNFVQARMLGAGKGQEDAEFEDMGALEGEANELQGRIDARNKKTNEYLERRKWNIDNICKVSEERSEVNTSAPASLKAEDFAPTGKTESLHAATKSKSDSSSTSTTAAADKPPPAASASSAPASTATSTAVTAVKPPNPPTVSGAPSKERIAAMSYNDFALEYEHILETYSVIKDMEHTREYLYKNCNVLLHEHAQSYLLLSSLEDEMNMKFERMKIVCRQSQILSHITELGMSTRRDPRDVIIPFFARISEPEYSKGFQEAVSDFIRRIQKRAVEKRIEMDQERAQEARDSAPLGPGGLNPYDVMEQLPEELRTAFEEQDTAALASVLSAMDRKDAKKWMDMCVASGLWVPQGGAASIFEGGDDDDEADDKGDAAATD